VGGNSGALRFDGVRFTPWSAPITSTPILHPVSVGAGEFWIATRNEFAHIRDNGVISRYDVPIIRIYKDSDGSVWTLSNQNPDRVLCHATDTKIRCFGKAEGITIHVPSSFIPDGKGGFWIGGDTSLLHWKMGAAPEIYSPPQLQSNVGQNGIHNLLEDSDGSLLLGIMAAGPGLGLERFRNGVLTPVVLPNFDGSKLFIHGIMEDSDKNLWIATFGNGIYRIHGQKVDHFGRADGLSSDSVFDLYEGDDGVVWAATSDGIDNFRDLPVTTFSSSTEPGSAGAASVMATKDGTVWVATLGTLDLVRDGVRSSVRVPGQQVSSLLEDHQGNIWVGIDDGLFIYKGDRFRRIPEPDHQPLGLVLGLTEDVDGNIWAECKDAQQRRLIRIRDFKVREQFSQPQVPKAKAIAADPKGGIWLGAVTGELTFFRDGIARTSPLKLKRGSWAYQITVDPDGSVMTASDDGLVMLRAGQVQRLDKENGLPCNGVNGFAVDDNKNLWLTTPCGFLEIAASDVQRWWIHPDTIVQSRLFDMLDGALPGRVSFNPAAKSPDGRLWFVNGTVLQMIDPSHLSGDGTVSPVYVETVIADRKHYNPQEGLQLPPLSRDLQISYTSPSFLIPQKVKFRYRLDGHDRDWQDAGTRREAFYTDLGPGKYRFRVITCNNSGVWNEQGATLDFVIAPAFYQTVWFRSLGVFLFLAVLTGVYRLRLRHLERQRDALRKSEKELRDVIDTIPATLWSALPDGSNTYVSKHFAEYSGISAEQTAGSGWQAVIHPDDLKRHVGKWMEAIATGKPHENEARFRRSDGQYRWHLDRGVPLRDENGNIVKWYGVVTEIEDRKRAEEALGVLSRDLQESKARLEEAQRITHVGYWERDLGTDRITWSDETYRIFGLRPQEDPIDLAALRQKVHPEDWEHMSRALDEALGGGNRYDIEYRVLRPTGEVRIVHSTGDVKRDASCRPYKMFGTVQDITDRKRAEEALRSSEQRFRLIVDSIPGLVCTMSATGEAQLLNRQVLEYFGKSPEELKSWASSDAVHPDDLPRVIAALASAIETGHPYDIEHRCRRGDGVYRWFQVRALPVRDAEGRITCWYNLLTDIDDRKRAEEALQQTQVYLVEGQRLAHMGSWAFDATGFTYWSSELFQVHGLDPGDKPPTVEEYLALVHPEDRAFMKQGIAQMLVDHRAFDFTKRIVRPDGEIRHVRCVGVPITQEGIFQGFLGTGMDVTEQERLTEDLRLSEQYLREGQRLAHMGSWAFDPSGSFEYWSQELFKIYGLDPDNGAPTLEQYLATVHPLDRDFMADTIKRMNAERSGCDVTKRIVRPDGEQRYIRCVGIPIVDGEDLKGFLGTAIDVTEQELLNQELERRQAYLTEAQKLAHTGSWAWRVSDRNVVHLSEEWYRIFGYNPSDGAPNWEKGLDLVHPDDRLAWKNTIERAIVEKTDYDVTFRIVLPGGIVKWIRTVGHPVLTATGDLVQFLGSSTDITDHKRAEHEREKLRQLEAELAHINRVSMLGEMAASLAHEIKQPIAAAITSANSCIEWLAHDPPNIERARVAATRIDKYGNRAAEIIDRIRSFYKKSHAERELVDVNEIINEMLALLQGEATRFSIEMRTELAAELPKITADRVQLQQVFMNLMLNAIEAMNESGGELTVRSELQDDQLLFSVSDMGPGLPVGSVDQIFSAFFTTKPQGSGMGLAISRSIVESHGGRIWATRSDGRGTTFHFTLPIQITESSPLVA